jgi:hypothetical protein
VGECVCERERERERERVMKSGVFREGIREPLGPRTEFVCGT